MKLVHNSTELARRLKKVFPTTTLLIVILLLSSTLLGLTFFYGSSRWLEDNLYDLRHAVSSRFRLPHPSLLVIGIDMRTLSESGKRWPWPREMVAEALQTIGSLEPRGIVVDILFQNPDSETGDSRLSEAIKTLKNVILISVLEERKGATGLSLARFSSIARISEGAQAEGFVWGLTSRDGKLRSFKIRDERLDLKSCALQVFEHFYPELNKNSLPKDRAMVVFARKNGGIPTVSLKDILDHPESFRSLIKDKVVVLGVTAQVAHDYHNTPLGVVAGAEILACSFDTLINNRLGKLLATFPLFRLLSAIAGGVTAWISLIGAGSTLITVLLFLAISALLMTFSELTLMHLPIAPFVIFWLVTASFIYVAIYFDNLFKLSNMRHEAESARLVQEQLLPADPLSCGDMCVYGLSRSANELGGDYFDYFLVKDRYLFIFIGDATGHGIPAALAMAVGKASVLNALNFELSPEKAVSLVSKTLFQAMRRKLMMTAAVLWIDSQTGEFDYINCGHPYPYKISPGGSIDQIAASGMFLGTSAKYRHGTPLKGILKENERILFYTDGLIESMPGAERKDGFELFAEYLKGRPELSLQQACADILDNHPFFKTGQEQPDDFTVLMLERKKQSPPAEN